jgi:hypothetical protein
MRFAAAKVCNARFHAQAARCSSMTIRLYVALLSMIVVCTPVLARDLVVDNLRGSDSQNDRGLAPGKPSYGPYRSISRALISAQPSDRIIITNTGKPYRECISLVGTQHSGTEWMPFEIVGNGATLDGSIMTTMDDWEQVRDDIWSMKRTPPGYGMLTRGGELLDLRPIPAGNSLTNLGPLNWTRTAGTIYFRGEANRGPFDYSLEVSHQTTGVTLYDVQFVVIQDLVVRGFRVDGINAHDRVDQVRLKNVTALQNGRSGITVAGASTLGIADSLLHQNGQSQLRVEGRGVAVVSRVEMRETVGVKTIKEGKGQVLVEP